MDKELLFWIIALVGAIIFVVSVLRERPTEDINDPYRYCPKEEEL